MNIGKFSVKNPVLINITMVSIVIMGLLSLSKIPREMMSDISFSWIFIVVPYPGASAEEVEKSITIKVEDELADIDHLKQISSTTKAGIAFIQVELNDNISKSDFSRIYQDVRREFDKVKLPDNTMDPYIDDFSSSDFAPMITININGTTTDSAINKNAENLQRKLLHIKNISKADIVGGKEREIQINCDIDRMEAFGVSLSEIAQAIKLKNISVPGGKIKSKTLEYLLSTDGKLSKIENFKDVIIRKKYGSGALRVSDVATVNNGFSKATYDVRFNGKDGVSIFISKTLAGNSIELVDKVKATCDEFKKQLPENINISYFNDTSLQIRNIIKTLGMNAIFGFGVLILVLFLFIGLKNSLITAMGIPVTFAISFIFMEWYGESLNGSSLFALVMVLGMVVDHAIVIIENSYRHRQNGASKEDAAILGTNEVIKPVITGTLTTIAAFLPFILLPGIMGKFMRIIPIIVSLALVASTIEALIILPAHFSEWGSNTKSVHKDFITSWQSIFKKTLTKIYNHRYISSFIALLIIILTLFLTGSIKQDLFSGENMTYFYIDIKLPDGTARGITNRVTQKFEERLIPLLGKNDITSITSTVGFLVEEKEWLTKSSVSQITVDVREKKEGRTVPVVAVMNKIKQICSDIPGAETVIYRMKSNGPPTEKPVTFRIRGRDLEKMESVAADYRKKLSEIDGLYNIDDDFESNSREVIIKIDEERAFELGLTTAQIGKYIRDGFEGIIATTFFENDDEIDVIVKFDEEEKTSVEQIKLIKFPAHMGQGTLRPGVEFREIPFGAICTIEHQKVISVIRRNNREREITISADAVEKLKTNRKKIAKITDTISDYFNSNFKKQYPDLSLVVGGEFSEMNTVIQDVVRLLGVGLLLIYIILGTQFKSYFQPLIIAFAIPFAIVGTILYLFISATPFSLIVMYAGAALIGISVNDSIVLISYINNLRKNGMGTKTAVIQGASIRLRPIILTSITTIAGLLPMALGIGGRSDTWAPMASTIIFGLLFSTIGTLFVIPCIYGILDDAMQRLGISMKLEGDESLRV